mmetsp:Transcript_37703/g.57741  ORF Transcript_37703/g.57741 Transcript_37703/m.57741 type:complete len:121 (+) Transcript_37703:479-841(+)
MVNCDPRGKNKGHWKFEEHARFLEALRLYGKDWEAIQKHVGNRDLTNIRSHAQKFLVKLVSFLEGGKIVEVSLTKEEAAFYHGVLNQKLHKTSKWAKQKEELAKEREVLAAQKVIFQVFK